MANSSASEEPASAGPIRYHLMAGVFSTTIFVHQALDSKLYEENISRSQIVCLAIKGEGVTSGGEGLCWGSGEGNLGSATNAAVRNSLSLISLNTLATSLAQPGQLHKFHVILQSWNRAKSFSIDC